MFCPTSSYAISGGLCLPLSTCGGQGPNATFLQTAAQLSEEACYDDAESTPCEYISDNTCNPILTCGGDEYEIAAPTATSNRVCDKLRICQQYEYEATSPTATSDRYASA